MKNAPDSSTHRPTRSDAAPQRQTREMPLLFQLADVNCQLEASPAPAAAPAPVEMPALPGQFAATSSPLASSLYTSGQLNPWPAPTGLFETSTSFSTSSLTLGTPESIKDAPLQSQGPAPFVAPSGLPAVIEAAVKAAAALNEPAEVVAETKPEPKAEVKSEPATIAHEPKAEVKTDPAVETVATRTTAAETSAATKPTAESTTDKPVEAAAPTPADKPSPASLRRQRAEARQQKVASGKGGDWLQTHGKIIAIGFVIALIATIYMARRNRNTDGSPPALHPPAGLAIEVPGENQSQPTHERTPIEVANTAPKLTEPPSNPHDATPSPATTDSATSPNTTAELQPPVVPSSSQPTTAPTSEPLFPWQNDSRAATSPPATVPYTTNPETAPSTAPALNAPTYPETNLRDAPLLPPAPPAPSGPASGSAPAPSGGRGPASTARSYPASFTSAPDGNRYERTGSGLY